MKSFWTSCAVLLFLLIAACGGDDGGEGDLCEAGCELTLAADCDNGPATQLECVSDCNTLRNGACGAEYDALLTCSEDGAVTCQSGLPVVTACSAEQTAFVQCLNQ